MLQMTSVLSSSPCSTLSRTLFLSRPRTHLRNTPSRTDREAIHGGSTIPSLQVQMNFVEREGSGARGEGVHLRPQSAAPSLNKRIMSSQSVTKHNSSTPSSPSHLGTHLSSSAPSLHRPGTATGGSPLERLASGTASSSGSGSNRSKESTEGHSFQASSSVRDTVPHSLPCERPGTAYTTGMPRRKLSTFPRDSESIGNGHGEGGRVGGGDENESREGQVNFFTSQPATNCKKEMQSSLVRMLLVGGKIVPARRDDKLS